MAAYWGKELRTEMQAVSCRWPDLTRPKLYELTPRLPVSSFAML